MSLHPLLTQQFDDSHGESGQLDLQKLLHSISAAYADWDGAGEDRVLLERAIAPT